MNSLHIIDNDSFNIMNYKKGTVNVGGIKSFVAIVTFMKKKNENENFPLFHSSF